MKKNPAVDADIARFAAFARPPDRRLVSTFLRLSEGRRRRWKYQDC